MGVDPTAGAAFPLQGPQSVETAGLAGAQARVQKAAAQIAGGRLEPAVVLEISAARVDFAANVAVLKAADDNTRRLLDVLA